MSDDDIARVGESLARTGKYAPTVVVDNGHTDRIPPPPPPIGDHQNALDVFQRWLHINDTAPVLAVAATIVANLADGEPVWLLLIGPPSGGKTEIISSCFGLPYVVPVATITEAALLSGTSRRERAKDATGGVLRSIGEFGMIGCKDFTSVLSQNKDTAKASMAALREIYDGSWDRPVGTDGGKVLHWKGKCGFLGGATPSYDRYGSVVNALGDRFLLLRLPDVDPAKQAAAALKAAQQEKKMRQELATAMLNLIASADLDLLHTNLSTEEESTLVELAEFTARVRTAVERDGYTGELLVMPQPEGPARLVKAMRQLYGALLALGVDEDTRWKVLGRIAIDCVPAIRVPLMRQLLTTHLQQRTSEVAEAVGMVTKTANRHLDDLTLLAVAERAKKKTPGGEPLADNSPDFWRATDWLHARWPQVGQKTTARREGELKKEGNDERTLQYPL